jgi:hypothetical protein
MNRRWYLIVTICSLFCQLLLPEAPVPRAWHGFVDKLPAFFGALIGILGYQAYGMDSSGKSLVPRLQEPPKGQG